MSFDWRMGTYGARATAVERLTSSHGTMLSAGHLIKIGSVDVAFRAQVQAHRGANFLGAPRQRYACS